MYCAIRMRYNHGCQEKNRKDWNNSTIGRVLALPEADSGSIPGISDDSLEPIQEWNLSAEPGVIPKYSQVWPQKQNKKKKVKQNILRRSSNKVDFHWNFVEITGIHFLFLIFKSWELTPYRSHLTRTRVVKNRYHRNLEYICIEGWQWLPFVLHKHILIPMWIIAFKILTH